MTEVANTIDRIAAIAEGKGLKRLADESGVPYTTLADWKRKNWRPHGVNIFERLSEAAGRLEAEGTHSNTEVAA